jgi:5-methyltetrahydrofolate--homocysteine methyltransferase
MTNEELITLLRDQTIIGKINEVKTLTQQGLEAGIDPSDLLYKALLPGLQEVGRRFETGVFFVPEMLIAAKAVAGALAILRPLLAAKGEQKVGKFLMGTVKGDVHDVGKNLCNIMLEGGGFEVIDLGVNVPPEKFIDALKKHQPQIMGMSAFLTTTMPMFKVTIEAITKAGLRDSVKIMVGGAPVNQAYAEKSGADAYAPDASSTARKARDLINAAQVEGSQQLADAVNTIMDVVGKAKE